MRLTYVAPDGEYFRLHGAKLDDGLTLVEDTLEGFVAEFEDTPVQVVGVPGQRVNMADRVFKPLTGSFDVVVTSEEAWSRFARSLRDSEPRGIFPPGPVPLGWDTPAYLMLEYGMEWYQLPVRLATVPSAPGRQIRLGSQMKVNLVSDLGVWLQVHSQLGESQVNNVGATPIWPRIWWKGAGGEVTLPSGATYNLPAVQSDHVVDMGRVYSRDGFDRELTRQIDPVSEVVQPGKMAPYRVPDGALVQFAVGVMNPWL